jgi:hypothetical protein
VDSAYRGKPDDEGQWPGSQSELEAVLGAVVGRAFDAEWAALRGPSLMPVPDAVLPAMYAVHTDADDLGKRLMLALSEVGFTSAQFPQLVGKVNARGEAMLVLGGISAHTVEAMIVVLMIAKRASETGPAPVTDAPGKNRPASEAENAGGMTFGVELDGREPE